jgi:hypothetical protein
VTSDREVEIFLQLFSDEGDEQKTFKIGEKNIYTADVPIHHGKGIR